MYSQYMDGQFRPLENYQQPKRESQCSETKENDHPNALLGELSGGISQLLGRIWKQFSFSHLDTGDILLVLIILFLFLEGDNLELVITLGLMLLLGFNDD